MAQKEVKRDKFGRPLRKYKGRYSVNYTALARELSKYTDIIPKSKGKKAKAHKDGLTRFQKYYYAQIKAGKAPRRLKNKKERALAKHFGGETPKGSKVFFLPKRYARKKLKFEGDQPVFIDNNIEQRFFPFDFPPDLGETVEDLINDAAPDKDIIEYIQSEINPFIDTLPKASVFSLVLGTGAFANESTYDRKAFSYILSAAIMAFVKSQRGDAPDIQTAMIDHFVGVMATKGRTGKDKRIRKDRKKAAKKKANKKTKKRR